MVVRTKETYENNGVKVIADKNVTLWLTEKHVEEETDHKSLIAATRKYNPTIENICVNENIALPVIKDCRTIYLIEFNGNNVFNTKEETVSEQ